MMRCPVLWFLYLSPVRRVRLAIRQATSCKNFPTQLLTHIPPHCNIFCSHIYKSEIFLHTHCQENGHFSKSNWIVCVDNFLRNSYSLIHLCCKYQQVKTESIRILSRFNFQWTKIFHRINLGHIAFRSTFFKSHRCN